MEENIKEPIEIPNGYKYCKNGHVSPIDNFCKIYYETKIGDGLLKLCKDCNRKRNTNVCRNSYNKRKNELDRLQKENEEIKFELFTIKEMYKHLKL